MTTLFKNVTTASNIEPSMEDLESEVMVQNTLETRVSHLAEALESFDEEIDDTSMSVVDFSIESFGEIAGLEVSLPSLEEDGGSDKKKSRLEALKNIGASVAENARVLKEKIVKKFKEVMEYLQGLSSNKGKKIIKALKELDSSDKVETIAEYNVPDEVWTQIGVKDEVWTVRFGNHSVTHNPEGKPELNTHESKRAPMAVDTLIKLVEKIVKFLPKPSEIIQKLLALPHAVKGSKYNKFTDENTKVQSRLSYNMSITLRAVSKLGVKFLDQIEKDVKAHVGT